MIRMGFNKRKMEDTRRQEAEKEAAGRRATEGQILEDAVGSPGTELEFAL